ncbi:MAG: SIMPL domain-containing protein [Colwellia sp.]
MNNFHHLFENIYHSNNLLKLSTSFVRLFTPVLLFLTFSVTAESTVIAASSKMLNQKTIAVYGYAKVDTSFEQQKVNIVFFQEGRSIEKLSNIVNHKAEALLSLAKSYNITAQAIQTSSLKINIKDNTQQPTVQGIELSNNVIRSSNSSRNISNVYINGNTIQNNQTNTIVNQYQVKKLIHINLSGIDQYQQFLGQAIKHSNTIVVPFNTSVKGAEIYRQEALQLAIKNAQQKATSLSQQLTTSLGEIYSIKELSAEEGESEGLTNHSRYENCSGNISQQSLNASQLAQIHRDFNEAYLSKASGYMPNCFKARVKVTFLTK